MTLSCGPLPAVFQRLEKAHSLQTITLLPILSWYLSTPINLVTALLPLLQNIHNNRKVDKKNKAATEIVEIEPKNVSGDAWLYNGGFHDMRLYMVEVKRLLQELLK